MFITIVFLVSCYKFEENILLFKNMPVFLNSTTWELVSFSKDGIIIPRKLKIKFKYNAFNKEGKKYYMSLINFDTTISKQRIINWEIIKLNSIEMKLKYKNLNSETFMMHLKAVEYHIDLTYD